MGGAVSAGRDNDDLIDNLMEAQYIKNPEIEHVFRAVDRASYFLPGFQTNAYKDLAWKKGNIHISAPCIYSVVMENLKLAPGLSFLNVGSGTGYLSTMVGLMLGPFGINHGIEMYGDVIKYAYDKLNDFKKKSPALDRFEFCEPVFVKGNALCLPSDIRQYDRVYCGAACPDNQENYMKNLIKVGGVLVMPHNDQLLQITRTSQTDWEQKSVLPVSFSNLLIPSISDSKTQLLLPDTEPVTLQAVCRSCIRRTLRSNAEREYPDLAKRRKRVYSNKKRACPRSLVIPFLDSSDEETDRNHSAMLINNQDHVRIVLNVGHARRGVGVGNVLLQRLRRIRDQSMHEGSSRTTDRTEPAVQNSDVPQTAERPNVPKREKSDSGVVDDDDNDEEETGKGLVSSDEDNETNPTSLFCQATSNEEIMDVDSESDSVEFGESEDEGLEEDLVPERKKGSGSKREKDELEYNTYSSVMKDKINQLPLPPILKAYVNLDREF